MKSSGFVFLLSLMSSSALASAYRCQVANHDDYGVEINLGTKKAALFDNNSWSMVPQVAIGASVVQFQGKDDYGDLLTVNFSLTGSRAAGTVAFKTSERTVIERLDCYSVQPKDLYSGI